MLSRPCDIEYKPTKKKSFLKAAERNKRIVNILKQEKPFFRMKDHFSEIIKKVIFFFCLNMISTSFRLPVIPEKLHQKSTWIHHNEFCWTICDLKLIEKLSSKQKWNWWISTQTEIKEKKSHNLIIIQKSSITLCLKFLSFIKKNYGCPFLLKCLLFMQNCPYFFTMHVAFFLCSRNDLCL